MPNILIETRAGWIDAPETVLDAVHGGVAEALRLPDWDRTVRLIEHPPTHFPAPPARGERFTLVQVAMFEGRSDDARRALYKAVADRLEAVGVPRGDLTITLIDIPQRNWGIRGGRMASDIDLGFPIDV